MLTNDILYWFQRGDSIMPNIKGELIPIDPRIIDGVMGAQGCFNE
jgi:hypothetical protein